MCLCGCARLHAVQLAAALPTLSVVVRTRLASFCTFVTLELFVLLKSRFPLFS